MKKRNVDRDVTKLSMTKKSEFRSKRKDVRNQNVLCGNKSNNCFHERVVLETFPIIWEKSIGLDNENDANHLNHKDTKTRIVTKRILF